MSNSANSVHVDSDSENLSSGLTYQNVFLILATVFAGLSIFTPIIWLGGVIEPAGLSSTYLTVAALCCLGIGIGFDPAKSSALRVLRVLIFIWFVISAVALCWICLSILSPGLLPNVDAVPILIARRWAAITLGISLIYTIACLPRLNLTMLLYAFAALVVFVSAYGLYDLIRGAESVLGIETRAEVQWVTGTFGNRNLFAAFLAISIPLAAAVVGSTSFFVPIMRWTAAAVILIITGIALGSSASRTGVAAGIVSIALWAAIVELDRVSPQYRLFVRLSPVVLVLTAGLWFGLLPLVTRYIETTNASGRWEAWGAMFDLPWSNILFGVGPGQFVEIFPTVQPFTLTQHYYYLHNDWLQFLFEFGAVIFIVVFIAVCKIVFTIRLRELSTVQRGALAGIVGGMICASADFPLHVLGTSMTFCLCIGVLLNHTMLEPRKTNGERRKKRRRRSRRTEAGFEADFDADVKDDDFDHNTTPVPPPVVDPERDELDLELPPITPNRRK